jgi:glycosyltransferase involved in cell wall biosynthesis
MGYSVLLVTPTYPPVLGGSEVEAQRVCDALRRRGHHFEVACQGGAPMPVVSRWTDPHGTPVRIFGHGVPAHRRALALATGSALMLATGRYDIAYFLMGGLHLAAALPVARARGIPILMKFSGSNTIRPLVASRLGRWELVMLKRWAGRILVLNPAMESEAVEAGLPAERLGWMPNPVDIEAFRPLDVRAKTELRRRMNIPAGERIVLFVGRMAPEKRLHSLLDAFAITGAADPMARLVLVGDGPLRGELEARVRAGNSRSQITFTGALSGDAVCQWMQAADLFALVSEFEGLPCSLIEAMSAGLTAVVSDIAANKQLIPDASRGRSAPVGDVSAIAARMTEALADPAWRLEAGALCRDDVAERFSMDAVAGRYEALFAELAG